MKKLGKGIESSLFHKLFYTGIRFIPVTLPIKIPSYQQYILRKDFAVSIVGKRHGSHKKRQKIIVFGVSTDEIP